MAASDDRRNSLKNMGKGATRTDLNSKDCGQVDAIRRKNSLSNWAGYTTVSWRADAQKDFDEHTSVSLALIKESNVMKFHHHCASWYIPSIVGALTATSGALIEKSVETYGAYRFGFCSNNGVWFPTQENCAPAGGTWVNWDQIGINGYVGFILVSTILCTISSSLTWAFAPMSRGSGIPEIKTILGGFSFPQWHKDDPLKQAKYRQENPLSGNTLVVKILGLAMSVGAGLSCGKEGPLVHIGCCWAQFFANYFKRYRDNEAKRRELLSCACASGVAVAFGAPLGGVLFSLEEASTMFPIQLMLRAFLGASVAAATLALWNPTGTGKLTMFNTDYRNPPDFREYPLIILIGIVGGCIGASFVHFNIQIMKARSPKSWFRSKCHIVLEVTLIGFFTAITSYHLLWTRVLSNTTIRALFQDCTAMGGTVDAHTYLLDLCHQDQNGKWIPHTDQKLLTDIFISGFLRYAQMCFTFGTGAAAGLFIPSLYVGAALGRIIGCMLHAGQIYGASVTVYPGMYAMLGAAGVLGGVCRVTISLVVIMFELTGGLQMIVPFMVVCMLAKWVGDYFTIGIYDYIIIVRGYPFLHEPIEPGEEGYAKKASDCMDFQEISCLHPDGATLDKFREFLKNAHYGGYPLTQARDDPTLLGYVHTKALRDYLEEKWEKDAKSLIKMPHDAPVYFPKFMTEDKSEKKKSAVDVSRFCDKAVITVVKDTPVVQIHQIFRNLGVKVILVREKAALVGIITKKAFIRYMEELHHESPDSDHDANKKGECVNAMEPGRGLNEPLLKTSEK